MENKHPLFQELSGQPFKEGIELNLLEEKIAFVSAVFKEWKEELPIINAFFKRRDRKNARQPMIHQLSQFLQVLFLVNGKQVEEDLTNWEETVRKLDHLPVNAVERLSFIIDQPDHYHSYIQLSELFSEWEKKSVILLRRKT